MTSSPPDPDPSTTPRSARFRLALLLVLVVVLLGAAGTVVWLLVDGRASGDDADDLGPERDTVMSQTRQFVLRSQTYGPDDLDADKKLTEHRESVEEVTSDKFDAAYDESLPFLEQAVAERGVGQTTKVLGIGVQYLDDDSARVLVGGESTFTLADDQGEEQAPRTQTFRQVIDLVKVDGDWLVDEANIADQASGQPSASTSPSPSTEPSPSSTGGGR
ncbi:hypothetical protein [Nocardioides lianchengensis]|uniref:Mce-associated membrane protein n=1 Tax=Nocardioides lianchengensis TaxID=1045774 RepID=A0A1G6TWU6_9ACTN|nr:hypothetical protein [Nocardioides lianchengensis]NYG11610.1 hypothetical protein [Nocardioides lianchengensis]SDD33578.1 hypothetical protein SAMN05421872_107227 [Nocardioides lianchengensis]